MKLIFTVLVVVGQVAVLGFMAGEREYVLRYGETVYLRTAPIDPRDAFRGDYVSLSYEAAWVPRERWRGAAPADRIKSGTKVYAALTLGPDGVAEVASLGTSAPGEGLYLRGHVVYDYSGGKDNGPIQVRYGLEQYYVQQGRGREIEKRRGGRNDVQIPMEMDVAVGPRGTAVIRGYRWSRLGIGLEVVRAPRPQGNNVTPDPMRRDSAKLKVTLQNVSEAPLALANPGPDCGFELVPVEWSQRRAKPVARGCANLAPGIGEVRELAPGEAQVYEIDLAEPRWYVTLDGRTDEIGKLARWSRYRLVYRSPDSYAAAAGPGNPTLWRGRLPSRAFNGSGQID